MTFEQEATIHVSLEVERLACALEVQDITTLSAMSDRLVVMANKLGLPKVAEIASELNEAAHVERDLTQMLSSTTELLELCRSAQGEYLEKLAPA